MPDEHKFPISPARSGALSVRPRSTGADSMP